MPLSALPEKKQRYVKRRMAGASKSQAAREAGYTESCARQACVIVETPDVRAVMRELVLREVPPADVVRAVKAGMNATKFERASFKGEFGDEREDPDWAARAHYLKLAAEYGGYVMHEEQRHLHLHALGTCTTVESAATVEPTTTPATAPIDVPPSPLPEPPHTCLP